VHAGVRVLHDGDARRGDDAQEKGVVSKVLKRTFYMPKACQTQAAQVLRVYYIQVGY
jgi:hypothetical protein